MQKSYSLNEVEIPSSTNSEEKLFFALLQNTSDVNSDNIQKVLPILNEDCFTTEPAKKCWKYISNKVLSHTPVSILTLGTGNKYVRNRLLPHVTDQDIPVTESDILILACELRRMQLLREFVKRLTNGVVLANEYPDIDEMQMYASTWSAFANQDLNIEDKSNELHEIFNEFSEELQQPVSGRIATCWKSLNFFTYGGFKGGNLIVLAARPGVGKSALALQMAVHASNLGNHTTFFALEMTKTELAQRMLTATGYLQPQQVYSHNINWDDYEKAVQQFNQGKLRIYDKLRKLEAICNKINTLVQMGKCQVVFIDYLQLIKPSSSGKVNRVQEISEITSTLKGVAMDNNIPIVLMSQLNRASASENRSPELYDLRESGSIEQDADTVLMLERANGSEPEENRVDMWVRKNRGGKVPSEPIALKGDKYYSNFNEV